MRIYEILNEYRIEKIDMGNQEDIVVLVDPGYKQLFRFVEKTKYQNLRGIYESITNAFYWWDADKLIHQHMVDKLGFDIYTSEQLLLEKGLIDGERIYVLDYSRQLLEMFENNRYIKRNFDMVEIREESSRIAIVLKGQKG